ncbi:hypothetical protein AKO1_011223 [Acrasis kona]|uniref:Protein-S-isoprenylcysteine O-methyltransferase n=1 Tax=Acrasis kona TaxID=1008807 RepID=A0AAW2YWM7_9EUKA
MLLDLILLIVADYTTCKALINPNKQKEDPEINEGRFIIFMKNISLPIVRFILTIVTIIYSLLMVLQHVNSPLLNTVCPTGLHSSLRLSNMQMLGVIFATFGSLLRLWCFYTLGSFFTFDVAILPKHELVKSGPYAYVRHPSYTALFFIVSGIYMMFKRTDWLLCFVRPSIVDILAHWSVPILNIIIIFIFISKRVKIEEDTMERHFKAEYKEYKKKTNKFLPFIL